MTLKSDDITEVRRHAPLGGGRFEVPAVLVEVLELLNWRSN